MVSRGTSLVINPDGVLNQLEGGIIQTASWTLKEGVRLDAEGISSRDWDSYTVLRFSKAPEVLVELINPQRRSPAPRRRRRKRRSDRRCIGNAVTHALGARLRDLPLTRERVTAALPKARLELGAHLPIETTSAPPVHHVERKFGPRQKLTRLAALGALSRSAQKNGITGLA